MSVESKTLISELMEEVEMTDPKLFPLDKKAEGEKVVGVVDDVFLQKLFILSQYYKKESKVAEVNMQYSPEDKDVEADACRLYMKSEALFQLFWFMIREKYSLYVEGLNGLNLRRDWEIVEKPKPQIPPILKQLFGGIGE